MITMTVLGRITKQPERSVGGATVYTRFSIATSHYDSITGQYLPDFIECILFGKRVDNFVKKAAKGAMVYVSGSYTGRPSKKDPKRIFWSLNVQDFELISRPKLETKEEQIHIDHFSFEE